MCAGDGHHHVDAICLQFNMVIHCICYQRTWERKGEGRREGAKEKEGRQKGGDFFYQAAPAPVLTYIMENKNNQRKNIYEFIL